MPNRCTRKREPDVVRRAAAVYLEGDVTINDVMSRFGIGRTTLKMAVARLRQARAGLSALPKGDNRNKRRALIMRRHRAMLARQAKAAATHPPGSKERP